MGSKGERVRAPAAQVGRGGASGIAQSFGFDARPGATLVRTRQRVAKRSVQFATGSYSAEPAFDTRLPYDGFTCWRDQLVRMAGFR